MKMAKVLICVAVGMLLWFAAVIGVPGATQDAIRQQVRHVSR